MHSLCGSLDFNRDISHGLDVEYDLANPIVILSISTKGVRFLAADIFVQIITSFKVFHSTVLLSTAAKYRVRETARFTGVASPTINVLSCDNLPSS
jgi:hypothetical protein